MFGARSVVVRWNGDSTIWLFSGITDPASKVRQQKRDPLGRLTQVIEDPNDLNPNGLNYSTTYSYDALDNLTGVVQGVQSRSFVYSSLSRLTSATNPESETTTYTYQDSGGLETRTDARGISVTFSYDGLHRLRTKDHSTDASQHTDYEYDAKSNLKSVTSGAASILDAEAEEDNGPANTL